VERSIPGSLNVRDASCCGSYLLPQLSCLWCQILSTRAQKIKHLYTNDISPISTRNLKNYGCLVNANLSRYSWVYLRQSGTFFTAEARTVTSFFSRVMEKIPARRWYVAELVQAHDTAWRLKFRMHILKRRYANFGNREWRTWQGEKRRQEKDFLIIIVPGIYIVQQKRGRQRYNRVMMR